jgi:DNA-binding Lrp family transcriptional regulator
MASAFIMVKTAPGEATAIAEATRGRSGVREAHIVAGEYDIIVEADGEEVYDVIDGVATGLRDADGVADTRTYVCLE